jgi:hypothetical protein
MLKSKAISIMQNVGAKPNGEHKMLNMIILSGIYFDIFCFGVQKQ